MRRTRPIWAALLFAVVAASAVAQQSASHEAAPLGTGETSDSVPAGTLTESCAAVYETDNLLGTIGKKAGELKAETVYERFDSTVGRFVFVKTDGKAKVDPRPLGAGSVVYCSSLAKFKTPEGAKESDLSNMCVLSDKPGESFVRLPFSDKRSEKWTIVQLTPKFKGNGEQFDGLEWQSTTDQRLLPVAQARKNLGGTRQESKEIGSIDVGVPQSPASGPGAAPSTVAGTKVRFRDGNTYTVPEGSHLEQWPGDPIVRLVPNGQELVRILRNGRWELTTGPKLFRVGQVPFAGFGGRR